MRKLILMMTTMYSLMLFSPQAMAQGSVKHSTQALNYSAQASGHSVVAGARLSAAVVAVPLLTVGAIGAASSEIGGELMDGASSEFTKPLKISDESVTAGPSPDRAVQQTEL